MIKKIEKAINIIVNILSFLLISTFVFLNNPRIYDISNPFDLHTYTVKVILIPIVVFVCAYISGYMACALIKSKTDDLCNAYQKRHESISIEKDNNNAKIATLEAKIETLEVALQQALKNK